MCRHPPVPLLFSPTFLPPLRRPSFIFFNATAPTEIYTLSLHDALPIFESLPAVGDPQSEEPGGSRDLHSRAVHAGVAEHVRSEEHTSELQSPCNLVCRLLLEKKKKTDVIDFILYCSFTRLRLLMARSDRYVSPPPCPSSVLSYLLTTPPTSFFYFF